MRMYCPCGLVKVISKRVDEGKSGYQDLYLKTFHNLDPIPEQLSVSALGSVYDGKVL